MNRTSLNGVGEVIAFLNLLEQNKIYYRLDKLRSDALIVTIHVVSRRIEVEFFDDHIEYSWFDGDESVHDDQDWLYGVLEEWVRD